MWETVQRILGELQPSETCASSSTPPAHECNATCSSMRTRPILIICLIRRVLKIMDPFNPKILSLGRDKTALAKLRAKDRPPRHIPGEKFLKGPVPLTWLARAGQLPGKVVQVGIGLWFLAGLKHTRTVSLSSALLRSFGVDRSAKRRALGWLEQAGLISVERRPGRNPRVTLLDASNSDGHD
jgi:DNA-binding transcriptional ArsR family regulator